MILAGDVGGTKCNLAVYSFSDQTPEAGFAKSYPSADFAGLEAVAAAFLGELGAARPKIRAACFGIAGPVVDERVDTTNLPWSIAAADLRRVLQTENVFLINDLEATGYGVLNLPPAKFVILNQGRSDPGGQAALIAAGTGLGESVFGRCNGRLYPLASEGGHSSFAPCGRLEIELLAYLLEQYGHVSTERVLSGPGLYNIYRFLRDTGREEEPAGLAGKLAGAEDPSALVSALALEGGPPITIQALETFVRIYGSEAANLALKAKASAGVFIGGGIAPKILPFLKREIFMQAFLAKGRMERLLRSIPVKVALDPKAALLGAACYGQSMAE